MIGITSESSCFTSQIRGIACVIGLCKLLHCAYNYFSGIGHYHYILQIVRYYIVYK